MKNGLRYWGAALLAGAAIAAQAPGPMGGPGLPGCAMPGGGGCPMAGGGREQALKAAGATDEQVARVREKMYETRKQMIALRAEQELARMEVQHLLSQDKVDREAVMKAVDKTGAVETSIHKLRVQQQLDLRDIVGADVLKKARESAFEHRRDKQDGRREDRRGDRWGGRGEGKRGEGEGNRGRFQPPPPLEPEEIPAEEPLVE